MEADNMLSNAFSSDLELPKSKPNQGEASTR